MENNFRFRISTKKGMAHSNSTQNLRASKIDLELTRSLYKNNFEGIKRKQLEDFIKPNHVESGKKLSKFSKDQAQLINRLMGNIEKPVVESQEKDEKKEATTDMKGSLAKFQSKFLKKIEAESVIDPQYEPPNKDSLALHRQRKEGKVLMNWMKTHLELQSSADSLKSANDLLELALTGLDEVISCYGKSCHEWAEVLQMIKLIIKQQFQKQEKALKKVISNTHHETDNKILQVGLARDKREKEFLETIDKQKQQIKILEDELDFQKQSASILEIKLQDSIAQSTDQNLKLFMRLKEIDAKQEMIDNLQLQVSQYRGKKEFLDQQIKQHIKLNQQLETEMDDLKKVREKIEQVNGSNDEIEGNVSTDINEIKDRVKLEKLRTLQMTEDLKVEPEELKQFMHDREVRLLEKSMMQDKQPSQVEGADISLDTIKILDSESEKYSSGILDEAQLGHRSIFEQEQTNEINEKRFINQGIFINKFMQELRINELFDKLQKYVQGKLSKDEFISKIISEAQIQSKKAMETVANEVQLEDTTPIRGRNLADKLKKKKKRVGSTNPTGVTSSPPQSIASPGRVQSLPSKVGNYQEYLRPLMTKLSVKNIQKGRVFKFRMENLYEIVYALLSQMFLTQIETIENLIRDLKQKFPNQKRAVGEKENLEQPTQKKPLIARYHRETQTGEEYDEFMQLYTIKGLSKNELMISADRNDETYMFNKIDTKTKKLLKIKLETKGGELIQVDSEEFLPAESVKNYLPFNITSQLNDLADEVPLKANIFAIEQFQDGKGFRDRRRSSSNSSVFHGPRRSGIGLTAVKVKDNQDIQEALNDYHKMLKQICDTSQIDQDHLKNLRNLALEASEIEKQSFSLIPPQHQNFFISLIEQNIQQQLQLKQMEKQQMLKRKEELTKQELMLDRVTQKIKTLLVYTQELEVRRIQHDKRVILEKIAMDCKNEELDKLMFQAHTDGFKLGLTHGKVIGSQIQTGLVLSKGQLNGVKHGWLSGYEQGQINGMQKVFVEAYMNNIDLYDKLSGRNKDLNVLELIDIKRLRKEKMNDFYKTFREIKQKNPNYRQKKLVSAFQKMSSQKQKSYNKIGKKALQKLIGQIYNEKLKTKFEFGRDITLIEAIQKHNAINYGTTKISDNRVFSLFSSALFNTNSTYYDQKQDLQKMLDSAQQNLEILRKQIIPHTIDSKTGHKSRINYQIIHFVRFLKLNDAMNNLSEEVLNFYLEMLSQLKDSDLNFLKNFGNLDDGSELYNKIKLSNDDELDVIISWRVHQVIQKQFEKMLPQGIYSTFKKNVDVYLRVKEEQRVALNWVDMDRLLDQSLILYLRYNNLHENPTKRLYFAWSLFTQDHLDFDQIYLLLKIAVDENKRYMFEFEKENVLKSVKDIMLQIHEKFGVGEKKSKESIKSSQKDPPGTQGFGEDKEESENEEKDLKAFRKKQSIEKINEMNSLFANRKSCLVSIDQFIDVFSNSNLVRQLNAYPLLTGANQKKSLQYTLNSTDYIIFITNCQQRIQVLKQQLEQLQKLYDIMKICFKNLYLDDDKEIKQEGEGVKVKMHEDWLCRITYVKTPKIIIQSQKQSVSNSEASSEEELKEEEPKHKTNNKDLDTYRYHFKPYLSSINQWTLRITRLEQKMTVLAPDLISTSFELYERSLKLLIKKVDAWVKKND